MIFVRNTTSNLSLEEQKLKLMIMMTECEREIDHINFLLKKEYKKKNKGIVIDIWIP